MKGAGIVIGFLVIIALVIGLGYNSLVGSNNDVIGSWARVETAYQRRVDLVSQSLPTVVAGAAQELAIFTTLRDQAAALKGALEANADQDAIAGLAQGFESAYMQFTAYAADNPEIVSAQLFADFMVQIEGTENRIRVARDDFNDSVLRYRNRTQMLPGSILAGVFGFSPFRHEFFEATTEGAENAPQIVFPTPAAP